MSFGHYLRSGNLNFLAVACFSADLRMPAMVPAINIATLKNKMMEANTLI
jgi:hypothetical protein